MDDSQHEPLSEPDFGCVCLAQILAQLQECKLVCRLVSNGEGTWEGRSYLLMELLGLNLAMYQRAHPHNGRINPTEAKRIGAAVQETPFRPFAGRCVPLGEFTKAACIPCVLSPCWLLAWKFLAVLLAAAVL